MAESQINHIVGVEELSGIAWADKKYIYCDRFVGAVITMARSGEKLSHSGYETADKDYQAHKDRIKSGNPPKGAVVYYGKHPENGDCGHVGIADGQGKVISVVSKTNGVLKKPLKGFFKAELLGWIYPEEW